MFWLLGTYLVLRIETQAGMVRRKKQANSLGTPHYYIVVLRKKQNKVTGKRGLSVEQM